MVIAKNNNEQIALNFVQAYSELNMLKIKTLLAENIVAHITNKHAELDTVIGRTAYMLRQAESDIAGVEIKLTVPQIITINTGQVMLMVSVKVTRGEESMHNHAAYLLMVIDHQITELWMVDALPTQSNSFWKKT